MPHEVDGRVHWHEPSGLSPAGRSRFLRPSLTYDRFMQDEGLPVHRATAFSDLCLLELQPWRRLGASGAFLQPFGTEGGLGCSLLRLEVSASTRAEKHLFEEVVLVLEGVGTTELWHTDGGRRVLFEWQAGSLFSIPPNALHRMVNAGATPALLLSGSNAAALLNQLGDVDAVFANPLVLDNGFDDETGQAFDDIEPDPVRGLALCRTGLVPDCVRCDLPLDNRFSPGYRQMAVAMTGAAFACTLGEHRPGRYSRAHLLPAGLVTICLAGTGFTYLWPERLGTAPWRDGQASEVVCVEQHMFAMTGAGPGGGRWYVQHFNTGSAPLRHLAWTIPDRPAGPPGEEIGDAPMIAYSAEDPFVRDAYARALLLSGATNRMRDDDYAP